MGEVKLVILYLPDGIKEETLQTNPETQFIEDKIIKHISYL
jgi:hypothetical protein